MSEEDVRTIVIDNGSGSCKVGFSADEKPKLVFPTIVGRAKDIPNVFIGQQAYLQQENLNLKYPIEHGIITNWDDMEKIWNFAFFNIHVEPSEQPVILTEPSLNPRENREKMISVFFETFNVPSYYVGYQPVLSLYASGRITGVALDIGKEICDIVPVNEGYMIPQAIHKGEISGQCITQCLTQILTEEGHTFNNMTERNVANTIKEKLAYVSLNYDSDLQKMAENPAAMEKSFTLSDGNTIKLGRELFTCSEILFKPSLGKIDSEGIQNNLFNSVNKCDEKIRKNMYSNITLSGGSTMFSGLAQRLQNEISILAPEKTKVKVIAPAHRDVAAWIGGSILSAIAGFADKAITKEEFEEVGPPIVHRKCF